ncbi:MAG: SusC/RagA family TonB-linked outer membrane protein [Sphingobacteriales bacterium]|nr:SusC/RagA family TonB-linked outer membrane protein [Sphingobacteriales bacterium]
MRKIASLFTMLMLFSVLAFGQNRTIAGSVTDEKGDAVPGASVRIKGTQTGVAADNTGKFSILANTGDVLIVSGASIETIEVTVGAGNSISIAAKTKATTQTEVVVTSAYGMKRTLRNVSTNTQVVTSEQLNTIRQTNLNNALAGKVSGLQVRGQSSAKLGNEGTGSIRLRGETGFGTGGEPIYVVDGTILPNINDVNMDDIEDLTVLQGPAASAIFGPQGARGAIVITLKKAKKNAKGIGVEVNLGAQMDKVYILPNYQNSYAGGNTADMFRYSWKPGDPELWKRLDGKYYPDYSDDASWGPRMVGQEYIPWYSWYDGHRYAGTTASLVPQPDNARDYYNTGYVLNNSISFSKASENASLRFGFNNVDAKGLVPTTRLKKNVFNLSGSMELTKKLTASINLNYATSILNGEFNDQYSNQTTGSFNQWFHRDLDMGLLKELKDLRTPSGIWASWNHNNPTVYDPNNEKAFYAANYWYNFYKWFDLVKPLTQTDRFFGDITLNYQLSKSLKVRGTYRKQQNLVWNETKFSSDLLASGTQTTGNCDECKGYYATSTSNANRTNMELQVTYTKSFKKFDVNGSVGTDISRQLIKGNNANTVNGLSVPNYYAISNSKDQPNVGNTRTDFRYSALYFTGSASYKKMLTLDLTIRQDWMSDLPPSKPFVASKAAGFNFIFSQLLPDLKWLSFGKLRASIGEIPGGIGAYLYPGFSYGVGQYQWNGNILMGTPNVLVDPNIHGFVTRQTEFGIDLEFLRRRVGTSITYWNGDDKDFATTLSINGASGFTGFLTNAGLITKRGMNFKLMGRPVWNSAVKWEINANWGILMENKVKDLGPGITKTAGLDGGWGTVGPYMLHQVDKDWGQLYGNGIKRINGQPVLDANGLYVNDPAVSYGSVLPKHTFGAQTTVEYKGIVVSANADGQIGGKFFSLSDMWGSYSGLTARTATTNDKGNPIRDAVADGGGVHVFGVDDNGRPVDYYVEAQEYFHGLYNNRAMDFFVYDLTFIKLREVSVGYNLPVNKWSFLKWANKATVSLTARNPVLIYAKTNDFDPSEISDVSGERGNMPGTRGWGINLKFGF